MTPGLASLIQPHSVTDFLRYLISSEPFVAGPLEALQSLTAITLEKLLQEWPHPVSAYGTTVADEVSASDIAVGEAGKVFKAGRPLMFDHAERVFTDLSLWLPAIRSDLGFSSLTQSRCLIYATPKGKGTAPHFDQNFNFVLQLHGKKKWWLAPNSSVTNPLSRYTIGQSIDPEMQSYLEEPMPTEMPRNSQLIELNPGSLLFVPPGMWHTTLAESDALSLNFTYHAPSWLDLLTSALRSRLALSPEWRATASGDCDAFDRLLADLRNDLPNWNAADILAATESE